MEDSYPTTVDAAVRLLMSMVDESEQAKIAAMNVDDLSNLHFGLGTWIRNNIGFYAGNAQLLNDSGETEPDDASMVIIQAFREQLRSSMPDFCQLLATFDFHQSECSEGLLLLQPFTCFFSSQTLVFLVRQPLQQDHSELRQHWAL